MSKDKKDTENAPEDRQVSIASTACQNCTFAIYEDERQIGCFANRLELYEKAGVEVITIEHDDGTGGASLLINGKMCVYYRGVEFAEDYYTGTLDDTLEAVKKELRIPYQAIIIFRGDIDLLRARVHELQNQKVPPKLVAIIDRSHVVEGQEHRSLEIMQEMQGSGFAHWIVKTMTAPDVSDLDCIDLVYDSTKKHKFMFYSVFEDSHSIPISFSEEIHRYLHDEMKSFVILQANDNSTGRTVLKVAHEKYNGNSFGITLEDKLAHYDDGANLIKDVGEICPSLKTS